MMNANSDREDLAYAAGIIDGEGCIGVYRNSHNGNYQLRVAVEMVNEEAINHLDRVFGGRKYIKAAKSPRKARTIWMLFNSGAESAIEKLLPFLKVKKQQAEIALQADWSWQTRAAGQFFGTMDSGQQDVRKRCHDQMRYLNKRGFYGE